MSQTNKKKYLFLDIPGVLEGEKHSNVPLEDHYLILDKSSKGTCYALPHGAEVMKFIKNLVDEYGFEIVLNNTTLSEKKQVAFITKLREVCKIKSIDEFPKVKAMVIRDMACFNGINFSNPLLMKQKSHGIWAVGYGDEDVSRTKIDALVALSKLLELSESDRKNSYVFDADASFVKRAKQDGWELYYIKIVSLRDALQHLYQGLKSSSKNRQTELQTDNKLQHQESSQMIMKKVPIKETYYPTIQKKEDMKIENAIPRQESAKSDQRTLANSRQTSKTGESISFLSERVSTGNSRQEERKSFNEKRKSDKLQSEVGEESGERLPVVSHLTLSNLRFSVKARTKNSLKRWFLDEKGQQWLGTCTWEALEKTDSSFDYTEEYKQLIAMKLYQLFGVKTPEVALSEQQLDSQLKEKELFQIFDLEAPRIHIMFQFISGLKELGEKFIKEYKSENRKDEKFFIAGEDSKYPLKGLGRILAVSYLICDYTPFSDSIGYVRNHNGNCFEAVKIKVEKIRETQLKEKIREDDWGMAYEELRGDDKVDFAKTIKIIKDMPDNRIEEIFGDIPQKYPKKIKIFLKAVLERKKNLWNYFQVATGYSIRRQIKQLRTSVPNARKTKMFQVIQPQPHYIDRNVENQQDDGVIGSKKKSVSCTVVVGPPGIGKTEFVAQYMKKHIDLYSEIIWLNAESSFVLFDQIFLYMQQNYDLKPGNQDKSFLINLFLEKIQQKNKKQICMIFENAAKIEDIDDYIPKGKIKSNIDIFITSLYKNWSWQIKQIPLKPFDVKETQALLHRFNLKSADLEDISMLTELLEGLPLAIVQAASFMKENKIKIRDYCQLFASEKDESSKEKRGRKWLDKDGEIILTTTTLAIEKLNLTNDCVTDSVLSFASYLSAESQADSLQAFSNDFLKIQEQEYNQAVELLTTYSVFQKTEIFRSQIEEEEEDENDEYYATKSTFISKPHALTSMALRLIHETTGKFTQKFADVSKWINKSLAYEDKDNVRPEEISRVISVIPHALNLCNLQGERKSSEIGEIYEGLGLHQILCTRDYDTATQFFKAALRVHKETENHRRISITLRHMGEAAFLSNKYEKAIKKLEKGLETLNKSTNQSNIDYLKFYLLLAKVSEKLGQYAKGEKYILQALENCHQQDHVKYAQILGDLGKVEKERGNYKKAMNNYEKALELLKNAKNVDNKYLDEIIGRNLKKLAKVLEKQGEYQEAEKMLNEVLKIYDKLRMSPFEIAAVLAKQINLFNYMRIVENPETNLERLYDKALEAMNKSTPNISPTSNSKWEKIGYVWLGLRNFEKAKDAFETARRMIENNNKKDIPKTGFVLEGLAVASYGLGEIEKTKDQLNEACSIKEKFYSTVHPEVASTLIKIGDIHFQLGAFNQAKDNYERAQHIYQQLYNRENSNPLCASVLSKLGNVLYQLGFHTESKKYLTEATEKIYPKEHLKNLANLINLGLVLRALNKPDDASELLQQANKIVTKGEEIKAIKKMKKWFGEDVDMGGIIARYIETPIVVNLGLILKGDDRKPYYDRYLKLQEKNYEKKDSLVFDVLRFLGCTPLFLEKSKDAEHFFSSAFD